jgi:plasmid maintenance system antidote protein VapI
MSASTTCHSCGWTGTYRTQPQADAYRRRHSCQLQHRRDQQARRRHERCAGRTVRQCAHNGAHHQHGTRAAYVGDRCRCGSCRAANSADQRRRHRAIVYGRWQPFVDAEPARRHVRLLMANGIGRRQIATLTTLSPSTIDNLIYGNPRAHRPPTGRIRPDTANRLLAISVTPANKAPGRYTDAGPSIRRLRALAAIGWSPTAIACELSICPARIARILKAANVTVATATAIRILYDRAGDTPPQTFTEQQRDGAETARARARRQHWAPPMAWDNIESDAEPSHAEPGRHPNGPFDIDEIAIERAMNGDQVKINGPERDEVIRRLTERGYSVRNIADRLNTTARTVSRRRAAHCR